MTAKLRKILIAEPDPTLGEQIHTLLTTKFDLQAVALAADAGQTMALLQDLAPDLVILDVEAAQVQGRELAPRILAQAPNTKILAVGIHSDRRLVKRILNLGVSGYLLKYQIFEELEDAVRILSNDQNYLSPEIILTQNGLAAAGKNKQSAIHRSNFQQREIGMPYTKKVKDLMIPLEDYPHIPYWFTLRQAMAIVREASIKFEGSFEPRAVLVFDEKYQLMGMLTLRDIIKGLEPKFAKDAGLIKADPNLAVLMGDMFGPGMKEASQKAVSDVMSPIKITVSGEDPITKAMFLMIQENVGMMPVLLDKKVVGMVRMSELFKEISDVVLGD
jgi:DNA-binding NarL/FixJ family response regulator/CBS domain-containing protein